MIYFDANATTKPHPSVIDAWNEGQEEFWHNEGSAHERGIRARLKLKKERETAADILGVEPDEIVFLSGATEASNIWLRSYFESWNVPKLSKLLVSDVEHPCVERCLDPYPDDQISRIDSNAGDILDQLTRLFEEARPGGVVMMAANNETGVIYPWREVAERCEGQGIPFFCDLTQWVGKRELKGFENVDFFCLSAHKFHGPKGAGILKISKKYPPLIGQFGGGQEDGLRSGTIDLPGVMAMVKALSLCTSTERSSEAWSVRADWRNRFEDRIKDQVEGSMVVGERSERLWNTSTMMLPGRESLEWINLLEKKGFLVGSGSACSTGKMKVSRVLSGMGFSECLIRSSLRISSTWDNTEQDWELLASAFSELAIQEETSGGYGEVIQLD